MKIEEVRTSFTVYMIASQLNRFEGLAESLRLAGYLTLTFSDLSAAGAEFSSNPPHFLIFESEETGFKLSQGIKQVSEQLPESHIFLLTEFHSRERAVALLESGVYSLIYLPLVSQVELVQALDRAAERDYFMYNNERLNEQLAELSSNELEPRPAAPVPNLDHTMANFTSFSSTRTSQSPISLSSDRIAEAKALFEPKTADEVLDIYMANVSQKMNCGVLYFRYIHNRRVLLASKAAGVDLSIEGVGLDFNQLPGDFRSQHLREAKNISDFVQLIQEVCGTWDFFCHTVEALNEIHGLLVYLRPELPESDGEALKDYFKILGRALSLIEAEKRLHLASVKDYGTDLLNRPNFIQRLTQEISRSRRTTMPVSLALITVDQYGQIVTKLGADEAQTLLRMVARIIEKHSRVTDVVGRTSADEFGLIMAHTGKRGALIKVERLRRIIESADFSRVLKQFPSVTISVGVSEYPSMVRDAEELLAAADEALYQVRGMGNRTCVSKAPEGFEPDFEVHEKGPL